MEYFAAPVRERESRLMLMGVDPGVLIQLERTGHMKTIGQNNVFLVDEQIGQSRQEVVDAAEQWIAAQEHP